MKNIEMTTGGNILTIKVDLSQRHGKSSSGKSTIIASTEGNMAVPGHECPQSMKKIKLQATSYI